MVVLVLVAVAVAVAAVVVVDDDGGDDGDHGDTGDGYPGLFLWLSMLDCRTNCLPMVILACSYARLPDMQALELIMCMFLC